VHREAAVSKAQPGVEPHTFVFDAQPAGFAHAVPFQLQYDVVSQASVSPAQAFALQSTRPVGMSPAPSSPPCHTQLLLESHASVAAFPAKVHVPVQPFAKLHVQPGESVVLQRDFGTAAHEHDVPFHAQTVLVAHWLASDAHVVPVLATQASTYPALVVPSQVQPVVAPHAFESVAHVSSQTLVPEFHEQPGA
jgi:hypothetical protein